jgi:glycosyltransferase involved in cell wall biosynthesis
MRRRDEAERESTGAGDGFESCLERLPRQARHRMKTTWPGWPRRRSAGVAVSWQTHRLIRAGDAARRRQDWSAAAAAYRGALGRDDTLGHIWIQLGHACKEAGWLDDAADAYGRAAQCMAGNPEPHLHLGHMNKTDEPEAAAEHFLAALRCAPDNLAASGELLQLLTVSRPRAANLLSEALVLLGIEPESPPTVHSGEHVLLVDVSDLLGYFSRARLPTGIQRVQIEVTRALIEAGRTGRRVTLCGYSPLRDGWAAVPNERLGALCAMSLESDDKIDPVWRRNLVSLFATIAVSDTITFPARAILINLGTSWSDRTYLGKVRAARAISGLSYVAMIYDCIPVLRPEWFVATLTRDFRRWLAELSYSADGYVAISEATRLDLLAIAERESRKLDPNIVRVARLDGDVRHADAKAVSADPLRDGIGSPAEPFVLMVSTIEPRKNHVGAFKAWLHLAADLGEARLPMLVCVGGSGWLNEEVHDLLESHPLLRRKIRLLSGVADDSLGLLYRSCLFSLYPSFYEGWGLPVTEALCHGKIVATSKTSAMPEAGGVFAVYFDPNDPENIAEAIRPLIVDHDMRAKMEARIRNEFRPRRWSDITDEILAAAEDMQVELRRLPEDRTSASTPA